MSCQPATSRDLARRWAPKVIFFEPGDYNLCRRPGLGSRNLVAAAASPAGLSPDALILALENADGLAFAAVVPAPRRSSGALLDAGFANTARVSRGSLLRGGHAHPFRTKTPHRDGAGRTGWEAIDRCTSLIDGSSGETRFGRGVSLNAIFGMEITVAVYSIPESNCSRPDRRAPGHAARSSRSAIHSFTSAWRLRRGGGPRGRAPRPPKPESRH